MSVSTFIFSSPVQAGKTSALMRWVKDRENIGGILAPDMDGLRRLYTLRDRRLWDFQLREEAASKASPGEVIAIGKFHFWTSSFALARRNLLADLQARPHWMIIDEIGKLELKGQGLEPAVRELVDYYHRPDARGKLLLVVREELVEAVVAHYRLERYQQIRLGEKLPA